jgi:hypothetical protein
LIDLAPLVTVIGFFQAPERWRHCFTTKLKIARAATSAAIGFIRSRRSKHWLKTKSRGISLPGPPGFLRALSAPLYRERIIHNG